MCGIIGFINSKNKIKNQKTLLKLMSDQITHRGPDDDGNWYSVEDGVGLGHRRLSILDLSPLGHQPMASFTKRYMMVFNGEIYNHIELRKELEARGYRFKGHSDTETILACFEEYSVEDALTKFNGMFAIALWDKKEKTLSLIRDRIGIKPLYYGTVQGNFVFASELKPIRLMPEFNNNLNREAITSYFRYNYIPAPLSIYRDIYKLNPGEIVKFSVEKNSIISKTAFWSALDCVKAGQENPWTGNYDSAKATLEELLLSSVRHRMLSDVPLGAFLSGGIDSSLVASLMQAQSVKPVKTFTIGFTENGYNEAGFARAVAEHLGTNHTELIVSPQDALAVIPNLPRLYDEPFSDSSQIPTFLVSQLTRQHVTVSLSGDGGDELFGGYNRHQYVPRIWKIINKYPPILRQALIKIITIVPEPLWNNIFNMLNMVLPNSQHFNRAGDKLAKLATILGSACQEDMYKILCSSWKDPELLVTGTAEAQTNTDLIYDSELPGSIEHRMMAIDAISYLPNDILTKVDRASMGVSLEARVPLLDHRVFEFAWSLPLSMKILNGNGKHILRDILYSYVPQKLIDRPKTGFGIPLDKWLRTELRDWAEHLLSRNSLSAHGLLNTEIIHAKWNEHLAGKRNNQYEIWGILMFQAWYLENA